MVILGIDPGTVRIGYGVIKHDKNPQFVECGLLKINTADNNSRIVEAARHFKKLLTIYKPDLVAIEKLFFVNNQKTGMAVAQLRGALVFLTSEAGIPIAEFAPTEVKSAVSGSGSADKKAMSKMVRLLLKLDKIPGPDDVSDALAICLTAAFNSRSM